MSQAVARAAYKPVGLLLGMAASAVSAMAFRQVWRRIGGADQVPDATDPARNWQEVVLAAALQGAIFAAVRAAMDRAGAAGVSRAVGEWPTHNGKPHRVRLRLH